ncbi:TPA: hypothetical protein TVS23_001715 [Streptococcus equi subsp. zooepidemicus]|nr:hypothetical protein [Streptococcus equi subsp. zooepidemicus]
MFKKLGILAVLFSSISLLSSCSDASNSYVGEWYSVENPEEIHFTLRTDNTIEIFDKNDYYKGEWSIDNKQLCISISSVQGGCGTIKTIEDIEVIDMGEGNYMAHDLENIEKLHDAIKASTK